MLALEFSITLGRTSNVDWSKAQNRTTLAGYHQGLPGEWPIHPVLLPKTWNLRRVISLLAQEITPSIRTKTKPVQNPNLCARAFAESNKFPNQSTLPIGLSGIHLRRGQPNFSSSICISRWRLIMLNLPNSNILLFVEPTDMRKCFCSLAMLVRSYRRGSRQTTLSGFDTRRCSESGYGCDKRGNSLQ